MPLTAIQIALKADVLTSLDPLVIAARAAPRNDQALADLYNATAAPAFTVWKTKVAQDEIMLNGFDWTRVDNLSIGKARVWEWLFDNDAKSINPSKSNIRAGIDQTWQGTAADLAVRSAVYVHCKRLASRVERLLVTGTGTDAVPGLLVFEGTVSPQQVSDAMEG